VAANIGVDIGKATVSAVVCVTDYRPIDNNNCTTNLSISQSAAGAKNSRTDSRELTTGTSRTTDYLLGIQSTLPIFNQHNSPPKQRAVAPPSLYLLNAGATTFKPHTVEQFTGEQYVINMM